MDNREALPTGSRENVFKETWGNRPSQDSQHRIIACRYTLWSGASGPDKYPPLFDQTPGKLYPITADARDEMLDYLSGGILDDRHLLLLASQVKRPSQETINAELAKQNQWIVGWKELIQKDPRYDNPVDFERYLLQSAAFSLDAKLRKTLNDIALNLYGNGWCIVCGWRHLENEAIKRENDIKKPSLAGGIKQLLERFNKPRKMGPITEMYGPEHVPPPEGIGLNPYDFQLEAARLVKENRTGDAEVLLRQAAASYGITIASEQLVNAYAAPEVTKRDFVATYDPDTKTIHVDINLQGVRFVRALAHDLGHAVDHVANNMDLNNRRVGLQSELRQHFGDYLFFKTIGDDFRARIAYNLAHRLWTGKYLEGYPK